MGETLGQELFRARQAPQGPTLGQQLFAERRSGISPEQRADILSRTASQHEIDLQRHLAESDEYARQSRAIPAMEDLKRPLKGAVSGVGMALGGLAEGPAAFGHAAAQAFGGQGSKLDVNAPFERLASRIAPPAETTFEQVLEGVGQTLPTMALAPVSLPAAAGAGALQHAYGAFQNTLAATGKEDEARRALVLNLPVGLLETALPGLSRLPGASRVLSKLVPVLGKIEARTGGAISRAVLGGITEGTTESAQRVMENAIANYATSEERDLFEGAFEEGEAGGYVGAILNLLFGRRGFRGSPVDRVSAQPEAVDRVERSTQLEASLERSQQLMALKEGGPPGVPVQEGQAPPGTSPAPVRPEQHIMASEEVATPQPQASPALGTPEEDLIARSRALDEKIAEATRNFGRGPVELASKEEVQEAELDLQEAMPSIREFAEGEEAAKERVKALQAQADLYLEGQLGRFEEASGLSPGQTEEPEPDVNFERKKKAMEQRARLYAKQRKAEFAERQALGPAGKGSGPNLEQAPAQGREVEQAPAVTPEETPAVESEEQPVLSFPGGLLKAPGVKQAAAFAKRELTSQGDLPEVAFKGKIARQGAIGAEIQKAQFAARDLRREIKRFAKFEHFVQQETASGTISVGVGKKPLGQRKLSDQQTELLNEALKGNSEAKAALPKGIAEAVSKMRLHLDSLSKRMIDEGVVQGPLATHIDSQLGVYLNRSYQVFDDPDWPKKVPKEIFNRAVNLIRTEALFKTTRGEKGKSDAEAYVRSLLDKASQSQDGFIGMIREGKIGSKDLSILTRRKEIAPEIRALLGEYTNPIANYMRSVQKMAGLIESHKFLTEVKKEGLGKFLHKEPKGEHIRKLAADQSSVMAPLNGLFTTPEIEQAFKKTFSGQEEPSWLRVWMKLNGITKYSKAVASFQGQIRNNLGNVGFAIANGHWRVGKWRKVMKGLAAKFGVGDTPELRAYIEMLTKRGVLDEGVRATEIREVLKDAWKSDPESFTAEGYKHFLVQVNKGVVGAYSVSDSIWKMYAFENEMARYAKAEPSLPQEKLEAKAADIVRNTYPTYSLVPRGIQKLRRFPLAGTFVSFPAEVFRTSKNTVKLISQELKSKNPRVKQIGAERLAGTLAASSMTAIAAMASRMALGMSEEDDENARVFMPPWSRNSEVIWRGENEEGNRTWIDVSYTDPWSYLKKPVMALLRGDSPDEAIHKSLKATLEPFLSEEIFTQAAIDVARNKTKTGREVYNEAAPAEDQFKDIAVHLLEPLTPAAYTQIRRIVQGLQGYTNQYGKSYDPGTEALATFSGFRVAELDPQQGLGFIGGDMEKKYQGASSLLTGVAARRGTVTDEELLEAYDKAERIRRASFKELDKAFKAAIALGVSVEDAKRGLSGRIAAKYIKDLEHGDYVPYVPSGSFLDSYVKSANAEERQEYLRRKRLLEQHAKSLGKIPIEDL